MLITVYIKDKPIYLSSEMNAELINQAQLIIQYNGENEIELAIKLFEEIKNIKSLLLFSSDFEALKKAFFSKFKTIEAAGGLVFNEHNEVLFIYRYDRWDLPKGKLEGNETPEVGGMREVEEECGVKNLSIINKLENTYHCFEHQNERALKITHWYRMKCEGMNQTLVPQTNEGITQVKWISKKDIPNIIHSAYTSIQSVINEALL